MKPLVYIASSLKNYKRVLEIRDKLAKWDVGLTFDWAQLCDDSTVVEESEIAIAEANGVMGASVVLFMPPCGRGAHVELGMAYATSSCGNGPMIVTLEDQADESPIAFYKLPFIARTFNEQDALKQILKWIQYEMTKKNVEKAMIDIGVTSL